ncbi:MAG: hypothetical protein PHQ40_21500 [Anaerolineaceae bacterium]|nr:hypothetical protein [Anaerolineaceae bacterium]
MPAYPSMSTMVQEALREKMVLARMAIEYDKKDHGWGYDGCLGFAALLLLMSVVDSIGSYTNHGTTAKEHLEVLKDTKYFDLGLGLKDCKTIYYSYRNLQDHNSKMAPGCELHIDSQSHLAFDKANGTPKLYLIPLYNAIVKALNTFIPDADKLIQS